MGALQADMRHASASAIAMMDAMMDDAKDALTPVHCPAAVCAAANAASQPLHAT